MHISDQAVKFAAKAMALHLEADRSRWEIYIDLARLALEAADLPVTGEEIAAELRNMADVVADLPFGPFTSADYAQELIAKQLRFRATTIEEAAA